MVSSRIIYLAVAILVIATARVEASGYEDALGFVVRTGPSSNYISGEEEEFGLDSEISRRMLDTEKFISYGALRQNDIPCSRRGASYYNCQNGAEANPYSRGCNIITRCSR